MKLCVCFNLKYFDHLTFHYPGQHSTLYLEIKTLMLR